MIKGTAIINHVDMDSFSKANRRKLAATLNQVLSSGKVALRKVMDTAGPSENQSDK
jgi:hypothetical protein